MTHFPSAPQLAFLPTFPLSYYRRSHTRIISPRRIPKLHRLPPPAPAFRYDQTTPRACTASPARQQPLTNWLHIKKAKLNKALSLAPLNPRTNLGLALPDGIPPLSRGTELAVLPEQTYLTSRTAKAALQQRVPRIKSMSGADKLSTASWLALGLLYEWSKGAESEYEALIRMLPAKECVNCVPLWTEEQREWLRGCRVLERAEEIRDGVAAEWEGLRGGVIDALFGEGKAGGIEMYRWAVGIVDTRGVTVGDEIVVAPVAGMMAARMERNAKVEIAGEGLFSGKKVVKVVLTKDVKGGEELVLGSGEERVRNADLVLERGVVVEDARADVVEMAFGLTTMDRFYEDKVSVIEEHGEGGEREGDMTTFELENGDANWEAPVGMDNFLRLICLGGADAFLLEGVFRGEVWEHMGLPVSAENEAAVCETVIGACEDALEGYGLTEEVDAGDEAGKERLEMARRVVMGEKRILNKVIVEYRRRRNGLDAMEYYAERRLKELDLLRPVDESEIVDSESGARMGRAFDEYY